MAPLRFTKPLRYAGVVADIYSAEKAANFLRQFAGGLLVNVEHSDLGTAGRQHLHG